MTSSEEANKNKDTTPSDDDSSPLTMGVLKKFMQSMLDDASNKLEAKLMAKFASPSGSAPSEKTDENGTPLPPPKTSTSYDTHSVPFTYATTQHIQHPHIINQGPPPMLDSSRFTNWKCAMESHVCSSSVQLWRIIKDGYKPYDPKNLTPSEVVDEQLNATAKHMLQKAMTEDSVVHIRALNTAKEAWDYLVDLYDGNTSMQRSKKAILQQQVDDFIMKDEETPEELFRRLKSLTMAMRDLGFKDNDDEWLKEKFLKTMMPHNETMVMMVYSRTDYSSLSPQDVLGIFVTMNMMKKTSEHVRARMDGPRKINLALRAKAYVEEDDSDDSDHVPDAKETYESWSEHMALAANQYWKKGDFRSSNSKNKGKRFSRDSNEKKVRTCFNCGNSSHFVVDCPYENRAEQGGKLIKKNKFVPKPKNFMKKTPQKAFVANHEEYESGGEEDDEESEQVGMAAVAIGVMPSSLGSLFTSPNDNKGSTNHKCLMAKASNSKVTPPPTSSSISTPSLLDCVEEVENREKTNGGFAAFVKSLRGETKMAFETLMLQLGEANALLEENEERIEELEGFARDDAEKVAELEVALLEEQNFRESLEEIFTLDFSHMKDSRDSILEKLREFIGTNDELLNGHNELLKDFEQLEKAHKALSSELKTLRKSHDNLQAKDLMNHYSNLSKDSNTHACDTNLLCDKASLIEENTRLKAQLEKGLATCIQGEKSLNDLLSNQKGIVGKEGLGFAPKSKKANNNKKKKKKKKKKKPTPPTNTIAFVKEGELASEEEPETNSIVGGSVTRGTPTHNDFAGKYNPSYVLLKSNDGNVFAKYVGTSYGHDYHWTIWVPKTLVTNKRGPIQKWVPKPRN